MGTNYYLRVQEGEKCDHCGRGETYKTMHVGKSSGGWKFCFDSNDGDINSFEEWKQLIRENSEGLYNEYGDQISPEHFFVLVDNKQRNQDNFDAWSYRKAHPDDDYHGDPGDYEFKDPEGYRFSYSDFT